MSSCVMDSETSQTSGTCAIETGARRRDREGWLTNVVILMKFRISDFSKSPIHGIPHPPLPRFRQVGLPYTCHDMLYVYII